MTLDQQETSIGILKGIYKGDRYDYLDDIKELLEEIGEWDEFDENLEENTGYDPIIQ